MLLSSQGSVRMRNLYTVPRPESSRTWPEPQPHETTNSPLFLLLPLTDTSRRNTKLYCKRWNILQQHESALWKISLTGAVCLLLLSFLFGVYKITKPYQRSPGRVVCTQTKNKTFHLITATDLHLPDAQTDTPTSFNHFYSVWSSKSEG